MGEGMQISDEELKDTLSICQRLDRLEILIRNLSAKFSHAFGDHALISGHWLDLFVGDDAVEMRAKAGYDRSGNLKTDGSAKGIFTPGDDTQRPPGS